MVSASLLSAQVVTQCAEASAHEEASKRVFSSFVCLRSDAQRDWESVVTQREKVYALRGCNYFTVNSSEQLRERVVTRFDEMVTPLMCRLKVMLQNADNNGETIESVHCLNGNVHFEGRQRERVQNEVLSMGTLFLSQRKAATDDFNYRNEHFVLLLRLCAQTNYDFELAFDFEDHTGEDVENVTSILLQRELPSALMSGDEREDEKSEDALIDKRVQPQSEDEEFFANDAIRKAVLLSRYVRLLREWVQASDRNSVVRKKSAPMVSGEFEAKFRAFAQYFDAEVEAINANSTDIVLLEKEREVLQALIGKK